MIVNAAGDPSQDVAPALSTIMLEVPVSLIGADDEELDAEAEASLVDLFTVSAATTGQFTLALSSS